MNENFVKLLPNSKFDMQIIKFELWSTLYSFRLCMQNFQWLKNEYETIFLLSHQIKIWSDRKTLSSFSSSASSKSFYFLYAEKWTNQMTSHGINEKRSVKMNHSLLLSLKTLF